MNALLYSSLLMLLALAGCGSTPTTTPPETVIVKVPVAVPCVEVMPNKPDVCNAADESRKEFLRCLLVNHARTEAYKAELEAILMACKGN